MATTSVLEQPKPRHIFARRFLELVIPPKIKQPAPRLYDSQNLAMYFYAELSEISEIIPNAVYLSGCSPVTTDNLESLGITAVVCALSETEERRMMADRTLPEHVKRMYVRLIDSESSDIAAHFDDAGRFIDEELRAGGRCLIHCAAGISRSATILLSFLMRFRNYDLRSAFNLVKSIRRVVRPNNGFFQNLLDYERSIFGNDHEPSVRMVKQCEDENEDAADVRLIPDIVLEHAKRIEMNDWRQFA
jgi:hypothetical protein